MLPRLDEAGGCYHFVLFVRTRGKKSNRKHSSAVGNHANNAPEKRTYLNAFRTKTTSELGPTLSQFGRTVVTIACIHSASRHAHSWQTHSATRSLSIRWQDFVADMRRCLHIVLYDNTVKFCRSFESVLRRGLLREPMTTANCMALLVTTGRVFGETCLKSAIRCPGGDDKP